MPDLLQRFVAATRPLVPRGARVLVGCSGGPDSLVLLDLTARARRSLEIEPTVAHLDHGLRAESSEDASFVERAARERGLDFVVERAELTDRSEASARSARLAFFARESAVRGSAGVLLGHSADDQAETVLLHALRGSGVDGLAGMRAARDVEGVRLLRPLLGFTRRELREYARARELEPRIDATNADLAYLRNRVRLELLPALERVEPAAAAALARLASIAADEADFLAEQACLALERVAPHDHRAVERGSFRMLAPALQRAVLRCLGRELLGDAPELTLERVEAARRLIVDSKSRGGAVVQWPGSATVRLEGARAIFRLGD